MYYFKQVENGETVSVESKSVNVASPNFIKTTKAGFDNFISSLPIIAPTPIRDLAKELDEAKAKIADIEKAIGIGSS